jgi:GT2 family glycosyltransferase
MWINNSSTTEHSPLTSIIILTFNGLSFTKECIFSIFQHTKENYELILVDNGSTDGTPTFLASLPNVKVIANQENRGFSGGCNQGLSIAKGENIVLLNNDTVVTEGWLTRLLWQLNHDHSIGIVGPRSNIIAWDQAIMPVSYQTIQQMQTFANSWAKTHHRQGYKVDQLSGLCMVFKRSLIDMIGGLDERFFPGYYEDTDFCIRAQISEKKLWVANDVFIHHYGSSSFKVDRKMHAEILKESRKKFLDKWMMDDLKQIKEIVAREKPFNRERHYSPF